MADRRPSDLCRQPLCVTSLTLPAVLVEHASEPVVALHRPGRQGGERDQAGGAVRRTLSETLVGPCLVVVIDELGQHPLQVMRTEDQQVVKQLAACGEVGREGNTL